jgi:hypothetical protein
MSVLVAQALLSELERGDLELPLEVANGSTREPLDPGLNLLQPAAQGGLGAVD